MIASVLSSTAEDGCGYLQPKPAAKISVVVAAFNVAPFIADAIASTLSQSNVSEVIVVDDASNDGTPEIVANIAAVESRVKLIKQARNSGPGAARNVALKHASGDWVAILDGDDLMAPERLTGLIQCAEATGADIIGDNFERITVDGKSTGDYLFPTAEVPFLFEVDSATFIDANQVLGKKRFSLGAIKVMVRTDFIARHEITHPEDLPVGEDFQFILSCLFAGARFVVVSTPSYKYRLRPGSQSWRLTDEHMAKLHVAHAALLRDAEQAGCARAYEAAVDYGRTLDRTTDFVRAVSLAKEGKWGEGIAWIAAHPRALPLVIRYGSQAVLNRLKAAMPLGRSSHP